MSGLLANAGTALMLMPLLQLLYGNFIIGLLEATALRALIGVRFWRGLGFCILANYVSLIAGLVLFPMFTTRLADATLGAPDALNFGHYIMALIVTAFVASFLVEWPIIRLAWERARRRLVLTLTGVLVAQLISHTVMIYFYGAASGFTLHREGITIEPTPHFAAIDATVYYIDRDDWTVQSIPIRGGASTVVAHIEPLQRRFDSRLFALKDLDTGNANLWLVPERWVRKPEAILLAELGPAVERLPAMAPLEALSATQNWETAALPVHEPGENEWDLRMGWSWAAEGVSLRRQDDVSTDHRVAVELPGLAWRADSPHLLPGDQLLYQLGPYIVLYDIESRRLAIITRGESPAVLPHGSPPATAEIR
jgi:hypothetical protein